MVKNKLYNRKNKTQLIAQQLKEPFKRKTCSFYRYIKIADTQSMRDSLYKEWTKLNVLGRVYLAKEGINAQISIPEPNWDDFIINLDNHSEFSKMDIKSALIEDDLSFLKLIVRIKNKIVADGINDETFDSSNVGQYLSALEFNAAMEEPNAIVVDMRNYYESEIGHFEKAICPDVDSFKESLNTVKDQLTINKNSKILLYCTGGIRCEKASAYLKHHNFKEVFQLQGGIIEYVHQVKEKNLESKFIGSNFVFDSRMKEPVSDDIISNCHQCDTPSNRHANCINQACHILFIQCQKCAKIYEGSCSFECAKIAALPIEDQRKLRKDPSKAAPLKKYQKGIKPRLKELIIEREKEKANQKF